MPELGLVDAVSTRDDKVLVNVFMGPGRSEFEIPFMSPMKGMWIVPERGDVVEVYEPEDGARAARFPHNKTSFSMPSLSEGDFAIKLGDQTSLILRKSGALEIEIDGDISITSTGQITIDEGGTPVSLAVQAHTHDVTLSDGSTGTTAQPNEAGSKTEIE